MFKEVAKRTEEVENRFGITAVHDTAHDPDTIAAAHEYYLDLASTAVGIPELPVFDDEARPGSVVEVSIGRHRDGTSEYAGGERSVNFYPTRLQMTDEDAETAKFWALQQLKHYPTEANGAHLLGGIHSAVVRVEWGMDPSNPYEVDTEPSGYGLLPHMSPAIRQAVTNHRARLGHNVWTVMPEDRVEDSFEHFGAPLALTTQLDQEHPTEESGLLIPFMRSGADLPEQWASRSLLPVTHMEDKAHLVAMGLFEELRHDDDEAFKHVAKQVESGKPIVMRGLVGSCAVGLSIYRGTGAERLRIGKKDLMGTVGPEKFLTALSKYRANGQNVLVRDFAPAFTLEDAGIPLTADDEQRFAHPSQMCAIKRYFVGFDADGTPEVLGGIITARKRTALIHGANDAIMIVVDPPQEQ